MLLIAIYRDGFSPVFPWCLLLVCFYFIYPISLLCPAILIYTVQWRQREKAWKFGRELNFIRFVEFCSMLMLLNNLIKFRRASLSSARKRSGSVDIFNIFLLLSRALHRDFYLNNEIPIFDPSHSTVLRVLSIWIQFSTSFNSKMYDDDVVFYFILIITKHSTSPPRVYGFTMLKKNNVIWNENPSLFIVSAFFSEICRTFFTVLSVHDMNSWIFIVLISLHSIEFKTVLLAAKYEMRRFCLSLKFRLSGSMAPPTKSYVKRARQHAADTRLVVSRRWKIRLNFMSFVKSTSSSSFDDLYALSRAGWGCQTSHKKSFLCFKILCGFLSQQPLRCCYRANIWIERLLESLLKGFMLSLVGVIRNSFDFSRAWELIFIEFSSLSPLMKPTHTEERLMFWLRTMLCHQLN